MNSYYVKSKHRLRLEIRKLDFFSAEKLLTSYMDGNNECHLEMTDDQSSSGNSSSEKIWSF